MKTIKKYTAIQVEEQEVDNTLNPKLTYGSITGPHYDRSRPTREFDTEEEAIAYAAKTSSYATWLIIPVIRFDNFDND